MATKINTAEAEKHFDKARSLATAASNDPNDPASANLLHAIHNYFTSIAAAQVEIVKGINELLERVERIENKAGPGTVPGSVRPR